MKQGPATTNSTALAQLGTLPAEWVIACMQINTTKLHNSAKNLTLSNNPTPLLFNQATPNVYQLLALCLGKHNTPS